MDLRKRLTDPGFTPSIRDTEALVEMLSEEDEPAELASRALVRIGAPLAPRAIALAEKVAPRVRARLVRVIGRLTAPEVAPFLLHAATDADPKTRRNALGELGRVRTKEAEDALLVAWGSETSAPVLKTIAQSLGRMGSPRALEALRARAPLAGTAGDDPELKKKVARATHILEREAARSEESAIDASQSAKGPLDVLFFCRPGLQLFLAEELGASWHARVAKPGEVRGVLDGPLSRVLVARLMTHVGFPLPEEVVEDGVPETVARALTSEAARAIFKAFTRGRARFRLAWEDGSHKRALVWQVADLVASRAPELLNDPRESTWEAVVRQTREGAVERVRVVLVPRALADERFAYRVAEVPAASHPTIAAALARLGEARRGDIVWDPFVGSGLELVERARLGPYAELIGTDLDDRALDAARQNLAKARVSARLELGDALAMHPRGVSLIVTNPPMGRRVQKQGELVPFLDRFVAHAAEVLVPGGRLVWVSPRGALTRERAKAAGFLLDRAHALAMGGFEAEVQLFHTRPRRG